jgi:tRNA pseudouridine38-40 synthase
MRFAYLLFYDGTLFRGFTGSEDSVEAHLRRAFAKICKLDVNEIKIKCASRTDPGVSAIKNVIAVDLPRHVKPEELNSALPDGIRAWGFAQVPDTFNPRSAYLRKYIYFKPYEGEDIELVRIAAKMFIGTHDFSNFQIMDEEMSPETTIYNIDVQLAGDYIVYVFEGAGFRNKMIRKIVWALTQVGKGTLSLDTLRKLINVEIRQTVPSAPAEGLVLVDVKYRSEPQYTISYKALQEVLSYLTSRSRIFYALYRSLDYAAKIVATILTDYIVSSKRL